MFLTKVAINWQSAKNPYEIHRVLWTMFPDMPESSRPFLFRVEFQKTGLPSFVLMQSGLKPQKPSQKTVMEYKVKEFKPVFEVGQKFKFLLRVNPTKRLINNGCRVPFIRDDEQIKWLKDKLSDSVNLSALVIKSKNNLYFLKGVHPGKILTVTFEGVLEIKNQKSFEDLFKKGVGHAKGFGCGMLSLARL
ncbi:MAG: type I-E CRISPR-associated protein Cas6/Cse3/CasE [Elusimicrobia bacterium]|nr:type I-E CRISPR-associated protein Cas6/Cse3/CasE [Elusimicrobiota bacterium]